jgi:hypothetical protein
MVGSRRDCRWGRAMKEQPSAAGRTCSRAHTENQQGLSATRASLLVVSSMQWADADPGTDERFTTSPSRSSESLLERGLSQHDLQRTTSRSLSALWCNQARCVSEHARNGSLPRRTPAPISGPVPRYSFVSSALLQHLPLFENP